MNGEGKDTRKVADRLRTLCSRREYCRSDILKKAVAALDDDREEAARIVEELVAEKYVDDFRYASAFARDKSSISGWGRTKIAYMLSSKGIARETIDEALGSIDEVKAAGKLERLVGYKARSLKGDSHIRLKLLRYALGRGYAYDDVNDVVNKILKDKP